MAALAQPGVVPRPHRASSSASGADAEGPQPPGDRPAGGGGDDLAPRDARRRAQLGLPLHLDAGLHLILWAFNTLGFDWETNVSRFLMDLAGTARAADDVRGRRRSGR